MQKEPKLTRYFFKAAIPMILVAIISGVFFDPKTVMFVLFTLLLLIAYLLYRERVGQELIIAMLIAVGWTSYYVYEYTTLNIMIGRINLFPFISWTAGLVFLREVYKRLNTKHKFIVVTLLYLGILFIAELIGYYLLGINLNGNFPSLLGLGVIHAPLIMKIFYVTAGPIYLLITDYLEIK